MNNARSSLVLISRLEGQRTKVIQSECSTRRKEEGGGERTELGGRKEEREQNSLDLAGREGKLNL